MSKLRAFLTHFGISATIVGVIFGVIFFLWYPTPYFRVGGASQIIKVLIGVDLVLGPLLTLIVYRPNKPRLAFDMSVIVVIQLAALIYGTNVIYSERPYYAVFAVDRFEVLGAEEIDRSVLKDTALAEKPVLGPIRVVSVLPENREAHQKFMFSVLFEGQPDLERRPEFWRPYAERVDDVIARARPLRELRQAYPAATNEIDRMIRRNGNDASELGFLPIIGRKGDFSVILDTTNGDIVDIVNVDPWIPVPEAVANDTAMDEALNPTGVGPPRCTNC